VTLSKKPLEAAPTLLVLVEKRMVNTILYNIIHTYPFLRMFSPILLSVSKGDRRSASSSDLVSSVNAFFGNGVLEKKNHQNRTLGV
jgi:hypothetical protein